VYTLPVADGGRWNRTRSVRNHRAEPQASCESLLVNLGTLPPSEKHQLAMSTTTFRTANPYEQSFGYSRAVRRGDQIIVSGTTAVDPNSGELQHPGSAYGQTQAIFAEIFRAIKGLGGKIPTDVVRVRMFVADGKDSGDVARAMREAMDGHVAFAATMICGSGFVDDAMKVEIEADAIVSSASEIQQ